MTIEETDARFMLVRIQLRKYYNEVMEIEEQLSEGEISTDQSEKALQQLDDKYAHIITRGKL